MSKIRKGDIVFNSDKKTLYEVKRIIKLHNNEEIAILKGVTERIELDSNINNLSLVRKDLLEEHLKNLNKKFENR